MTQLGHIQNKTKVLAEVVQFQSGVVTVSSIDVSYEPAFMVYPDLQLLQASINMNQKLVWDQTWLPVLVTGLLAMSDELEGVPVPPNSDLFNERS